MTPRLAREKGAAQRTADWRRVPGADCLPLRAPRAGVLFPDGHGRSLPFPGWEPGGLLPEMFVFPSWSRRGVRDTGRGPRCPRGARWRGARRPPPSAGSRLSPSFLRAAQPEGRQSAPRASRAQGEQRRALKTAEPGQGQSQACQGTAQSRAAPEISSRVTYVPYVPGE